MPIPLVGQLIIGELVPMVVEGIGTFIRGTPEADPNRIRDPRPSIRNEEIDYYYPGGGKEAEEKRLLEEFRATQLKADQVLGSAPKKEMSALSIVGIGLAALLVLYTLFKESKNASRK